jgi:hypothetical protein
MTAEQAKQWLPVIQALAEGQEIQCRWSTKKFIDNYQEWRDTKNPPVFDENYEFRIKRKPNYVPYKKFDLKWLGKIVRHKDSDYCFMITTSSGIYYPTAFRDWEWYDVETGQTSPFGELADGNN